jgi:REP element-mobilizing transposase RayT
MLQCIETLGMNEKYKNKYRIASARAVWWDYGWAGAYFITIITRNRVHCFGNIKNQCMILSPVGVLANVFWHEIPNHAPNVDLGAFVVMPDHFHGILILSPPDSVVETRHALPLQKPAENRFQNQGKNTVSSLVGSYKSAVTRHANRLGLEFAWQPRFHDHIIQNDAEYQRINDYIENNPLKWMGP